jgi:hypothetical protein
MRVIPCVAAAAPGRGIATTAPRSPSTEWRS